MLNIVSVAQKQKEKTISFPTLIKEEFTFQKFLRTAKQDSHLDQHSNYALNLMEETFEKLPINCFSLLTVSLPLSLSLDFL